MTAADIPLLDLRPWREGGATERQAFAARLDGALRDSGFLLVDGHGVAAELRADVRAAALRFFTLPVEEKRAIATPVGGRGWIPAGGEANAFHGETPDPARADLKESLTMGRDLVTGDPEVDRTWFAPNVFPAQVPELEGLCREYADAVREVNDDLLRACATALGLAEDWFVVRSARAHHTFNVNRYPARSETGPALPGQFRVAPHTDWGLLTLLDRQPGYGGLQVQTREGTWDDAPFVPDTFTVNVGDLLARWTGDRWRSTRHRVLPPPAQAPDEELVSLILFFETEPDTVVEPLFPGSDHAPVTAGDWFHERVRAATVG